RRARAPGRRAHRRHRPGRPAARRPRLRGARQSVLVGARGARARVGAARTARSGRPRGVRLVADAQPL
ncbi:MAG: hypothetical protein AVDCRST_MAG40-2480, partial [uncultured Gemmatimonadaceae bacterium]